MAAIKAVTGSCMPRAYPVVHSKFVSLTVPSGATFSKRLARSGLSRL
jgi:hypothetical protein